MKLPSLPFFQKSEAKEYFLSLLFQEEQIQAVIFEEVNKSLRIVNSSIQKLSQPLENISFENLLTTLDKAISTAENALPQGVQTQKTIFGLKQEWVDGGQIKKEYLLTLKKACEELDLQPIGFLVFPEAIAHLLKLEEGAPVSAILIEIGTQSLSATLLRAGRIIESHHSSIQQDDDLPKKVDSLLAHFVDLEILPSRIIIADDQKRPNLIQKFIHHQWSKQLPFLHVPQVSPLPEGFDIQAILHGTATQLGFRVGDTPTRPIQQAPTHTFDQTPMDQEPQNTPQEVIPEEENVSQTEEPIREEIEEAEEKAKSEKVDEKDADEFGFVHDKDIAQSTTHPTTFQSHLKDNAFEESEEDLAEETFENIPEKVKEDDQDQTHGGFPLQGVLTTAGMQQVLGKLQRQVKNGNVSFQTAGALFGKVPSLLTPLQGLLRGPKLLLGLPIIFIFLVIFFLWYIFGLSATVTLSLNTSNIDSSSPITITTKDTTDLGKNLLGGTAVSVDESGSVTTDATGKKDTGDKAKGTVTLYNNSDSTKSFDAGTTITSENGLKFTLDKDVKVASASGDIFSGTKPGTQDITVTASTFGTDYNLPSGTKFSVSGTSSVAGKNANAFSGGTKKSLTVVSANDLSKAQDDLINSLESKAKQDMQKQNGSDKNILPIFTSTTLGEKTTDKKEGDEASSVTLTATVTFESIAYTSGDVKQLSTSLLQNKIPTDMTLTSQGIQGNIEDITAAKDGSSAKATLKASAQLIPKLNTSDIAKRLAGKSFSDINATLSDIKQLQSADVVLSPNLFFLPHILPRLSSHITIKISQ